MAGALVASAGCRKADSSAAPAAPQADPADVKKLMATLVDNEPVPMGVPTCKPSDYPNTATMTARTTRLLAGRELLKDAEWSDWINPEELDIAPARTLLTSTDETAKREAAAELLAAPAYFVYRVEILDVALALDLREIRRGHVAARAFRYDKSGKPTCFVAFNFKPSPKTAEWAQDEAERAPTVPKRVVETLRKDLHARYLREVFRQGLPQPPASAPAPATDDGKAD